MNLKWRNPFDKQNIDKLFKASDIFCDVAMPDYVQQGCGVETGGIPFVAFIDGSVEIDESDLSTTLESADFWTGNINTSPSTRFVILKTRGSKAAGTPSEEDGFGFNVVERTGDDKELVFEALGVRDNRNFWATANKKNDWQIVYGTTTTDENGDYLAFFAKNVSIYADEMIEQNLKTRIRYSVSAKWSTDLTPSLPFNFPKDVITALQA